MRFEDLPGRDVVIWGAGREGRAAHAELERRGVAATYAITGENGDPDALARLSSADIVIKSPGVPHTAPEFVRLRELGVAITSLTDLWLSTNAARVLAVTGTKGKSTTSALAHHVLTEAGITASLVGNGGTPVTEDDAAGSQVAVAEISSYQAADLTTSPRIAVITSLYPEHLPWHGGFEQYVADKLNLVAHGCEIVVVPDLAGDVAGLVRPRSGDARLVDPAALGIGSAADGLEWAGVGRLDAEEIPVRGRHNVANLALALAAVAAGFDVDRAGLLAAAASFAPLSHRLEEVPSADGRRWVDDSLATAPEAVVAALETYPQERVALLLGGSDRGLSFAPLREYLTGREGGTVEVIAVGPAGARWVAEGGDATLADDFADALRRLRLGTDADIVLLSPGAPSFDEFASYEERSAAFRAAAAAAG